MRYLIATAGSHGDVLPLIAIGRELVERGNEVFIYGTPLFKNHVIDERIRFISVSSDAFYYQVIGMLSRKHPIKSMSKIMHIMASNSHLLIDRMCKDVLPDQTIVIGSSMMPAHRIVAEIHNILVVSVHLSPVAVFSNQKLGRSLPEMDLYRKYLQHPLLNRVFWQWVERFISKPNFIKPLNIIRRQHNLKPMSESTFKWINKTDLLIGLFPKWFANPPSDWDSGLQMTDFPLYDSGNSHPMTEDLQQFLQLSQSKLGDQKPVVFSAGTATSDAYDFFVESVKACQLLGLSAILVSHIPEQIPDKLPDNIIATSYAPFSQLLPKASVFVHHGGIGNTAQALLAGIPQLIRPVAFDQFDNAERVVELGVGLEVLPKDYKAQVVADALQKILQGEYQKSCQIYANKITLNAITDSCDLIENLADAHR